MFNMTMSELTGVQNHSHQNCFPGLLVQKITSFLINTIILGYIEYTKFASKN
jgi:hypothetical protein